MHVEARSSSQSLLDANRPAPDQLFAHYMRAFSVLRADTPRLRAEAYRLRYNVYCVENSFENPADFPDGLESDAFDARAELALLKHRASDSYAGTIRVILPAADGAPLPAIRLLAEQGVDTRAYLPPGRTAELSRFAVTKNFRRRVADRLPDGAYPALPARVAHEQRIIPVMTLGLMMAALQIGVERGMTHGCAVVEPPLLRLLARHCITLEPLGPRVDYHGIRQPCYFVVEELLDRLHRERPDLWDVITDNGRLA